MKKIGWWGMAVILLNASPTDDFVIRVTTDRNGTSSDTQFTIPITRTSGSGYNVDCDDDGVDEVTGATTATYPDGYTCDYPAAGTYTIRIRDNNGDRKGFRRILFDNQGDVLKLVGIEQWGTAVWSSMNSAFYGAANLEVNASDAPDLSAVTSLKQMFRGCTLADPEVRDWNVSTITNFSSMFRDATSADPDVSVWVTSSATSMVSMFQGAVSADPDVSGWNVSQVSAFSSMFRGATAARPETSGWQTSSAFKMDSMFREAVSANPDVSGWDTSRVSTFASMFYGATNADPDVSGWDTSGVTTMSSMFREASTANPDVSDWNVSRVTDFSSMFYGATSAAPNVADWNVSSGSDFASMFREATAADPDVSRWDLSSATDLRSMFRGAVNADPNVTDWNTSSVTRLDHLFEDTAKADPDVSRWDTSQVTTFYAMFQSAQVADPDVSRWDTSQVTTMVRMFRLAPRANPDVRDWNTSRVTTVKLMFDQASSFDRSLGRWEIGSLTDATTLFRQTKISVAHYDDTLIRWAKQSVQSGVNLSSDARYCRGEAARQSLIDDDGWSVSDGGKACSPCGDTPLTLRSYQWKIISFPCETGSNTIDDLFGGDLGTYGTKWVMYRQSGSDDYEIGDGHRNTDKIRLESNDTVEPGRGYWIIADLGTAGTEKNITIPDTLPDLNLTSAIDSSTVGIDDGDFSLVHQSPLPKNEVSDPDTIEMRKYMAGNPFAHPFHLRDLYFRHDSSGSAYHAMGDSANDPYISSIVYKHDSNQTSSTSGYEAVDPSTPGFGGSIEVFDGFFIKILKNQSDSDPNRFAYPLILDDSSDGG